MKLISAKEMAENILNPELKQIMEEKKKLTFEIVNLFDMVESKVITFDKAKDDVRLLIEYCNVNQHVTPIAGKNQPTSTTHRLGVATTIGELRKMIENYPDDTSFGFRNQPMQELCEVKYPDVMFVVFQEGLPEAQGEVEKTYRYAIYQAQKAIKNFNDALLTARDQVQKTKKSKQSWMKQILLRPFYLLLKKDMIRLLSKKHGEQFIDDVMQTFEMPTNLMDKYFKPHKNQ